MKSPAVRSSFTRWILQWLKMAAGLLVFCFIARMIGLFYFGQWRDLFADQTGDLLLAFWMGARFDSVVVAYGMVLPVLAFLLWICFPGPAMARFLTGLARAWFVVFFFSVVGVTLGDLGYYSYFQDHLNILVFGLFEDDTWALLRTFQKNYPLPAILVGALLLIYGLIRASSRLFRIEHWRPEDQPLSRRSILAFICCIPLLGLAARGSVKLFPLHEIDATISPDPFINYLAYSGIHGLFRAFKVRKEMGLAWDTNARFYGYDNWKSPAMDHFGLKPEELPEDPLELIRQTTPANPWAEKTRPHVVVLMMESWGGYWLRFHSPEFNLLGDLEKHFQEDIVLKNFLPSMTATIGSLTALMVNSPHRPTGHFLSESRYMQVPFRFAPSHVFKAAGYKTRFIYGGGLGWRSIDRFARVQGYDSVEGDVSIERKLNRPIEKHDWGIYDEDLFEYLRITLEEAKEPQLVFVMTTTNHPPYQVPKTYTPLPLNYPEELQRKFTSARDIVESRFRVFQYANQKLGEFLTQIKSGPLHDKTVLAATGDHGFLLINFTEQQHLQKWQVPLYLYLPQEARKTVDRELFASHIDIFPTLFEVALSKATHYSFGTSIFNPKSEHQAYYYNRLAISRHGAIIAGQTPAYLRWETPFENLIPSEETPELSLLYKKYVSLMGLIDYFYDYELRHWQEKNR